MDLTSLGRWYAAPPPSLPISSSFFLQRPAGKSPRREVPRHIPRPDYAEHPKGIPEGERIDRGTNSSIRVYTPEEIQGIREACRIGRECLDIASAAIRVGVTCDEIDRVVSSLSHSCGVSSLLTIPRSMRPLSRGVDTLRHSTITASRNRSALQ